LERYAEVARSLTARSAVTALATVEWLHALCADLNIPALAQFGVSDADFATIIAQAQKANSMKGNPIALTDNELREVLQQAR
jgi:alcohol dehydrogenase class IV